MYRTMNQRFKEAFEKLKEAEVFKTQREFVQPLEWNQSTLSDVLKNKRPLPIEIAITFCDKYNVNHEWLLHGKGKMLKEGAMLTARSPTDNSNLSEDQKEILRLQNIIAEKNTIIEDKNKHIAALEKIVMYQEGMILKVKKKVATIVHPKTRQS